MHDTHWPLWEKGMSKQWNDLGIVYIIKMHAWNFLSHSDILDIYNKTDWWNGFLSRLVFF